MSELHTLADSESNVSAIPHEMASRAYTRAKTQRRLIVGALVVAFAVGVGALVACAPALLSARRAYLAGVKYEAGMHALKGDTRTQDLNAAKYLFTEALLNGDARGHYGLACIMYQQSLRASGLSAAAIRLRMEITFTNLAHAANRGSLPAQAALVSYHPWEDQEESNRLILNLLKAAKNSELSRSRDPALPRTERVDQDSTAYVVKMLQQGLCAPALSDDEVNLVMARATRLLVGTGIP